MLRFSSRRMVVKRGTRIARMMEHERWYRVFSATCVGVSLATETGLTESVEDVSYLDKVFAPVIVMPAVPKIDRRRYVTKKDLVKCGYTRRVSSIDAVGVKHAQCESFLMMTDPETELASSWQVMTIRDKLSE